VTSHSFFSQSEAGIKKCFAKTDRSFTSLHAFHLSAEFEMPVSNHNSKNTQYFKGSSESNPSKGIRVDIKFYKKGELIFISHLDMMRLFLRTFRRAEIPLLYTRGFNPRPKISFERALPLGVKGRKEKMTIFLTQRIELKNTKKKINKLLPKGIQIIKMAYKSVR